MQCSTVNSPDAVLPKLAEEEFDLLLMDMNYHQERTGGQEGLNLLRSVNQSDPSLPIVVMTAWGSIPLAVQAVQLGAKDFLQKPWENERLLSIVRNQIELRAALKGKERLEAENSVLRSAQASTSEFVALSPGMQEVKRIVEQVAPSDANILITGENGTGKGVVARLLHQLSGRLQQPLISVNMGGIPETLFESEMFGHVKGAFTDARADRVGRFELADGGTLFLDEIANLTGSQQAKILRVLETGEFERVGSSKTKQANVRILSATNADLLAEINAGRFREDLYFRLNTIQVHLPALRERLDDIPELTRYFLGELTARYRKQGFEVSPEALQALRRYPWPGNIRELRHVMERAVLLARSQTIEPTDLGLQSAVSRANVLDEMDLESMEAHLIKKALDRHNGNAISAAKALGLSRSAFYRRLQKYQIPTTN
jgi:DNA-binding NtrC family response regulator